MRAVITYGNDLQIETDDQFHEIEAETKNGLYDLFYAWMRKNPELIWVEVVFR